MTTDNRANEPTEAQVEAAAKAIWERSAKIDDPFWDGGALDYGIKQIYRADARAALVAAQGVGVAPQEPCPQPCEHLSAEDAREGRDCREHPCTCPTSPFFDREKLIEEARRMAPFYDKSGTLEVARLLTRLADALEAATRERDAALAVLERIREAVSGHPECDRYEEGDVISCGWKSAYASVVAALDGAPEPEEKR